MRRTTVLLVVALVALASACKQSDKAESEPKQSPVAAPEVTESSKRAEAAGKAWGAFVDEFIENSLRANPPWAVREGRHEYDGKVPDFSTEGIEAEIARLEEAKEKATGFDAADLRPEHAFERRYLIAYIDGELFWLDEMKQPFTHPFYYSRAVDPHVYVTREYAPLSERMVALTALMTHIPEVVGHMRENLEAPMPKTYAHLGVQIFGGMASFYDEDVPALFADTGDEAQRKAFEEANAAAVAALKETTAWLEKERARGTDDYAIGAERLARMLEATEGVTTPLDELERIGRADLERNLAALEQACAKIVPEKPIPACIANVQARKPEGGPVARANEQLGELEAFLREKELVSIPGEERAKVEEAPPYNRWNMAYITIPGPWEKELPSVYYIAPPDPSWSKKDRLAYVPGEADLLFVSVHEVWPGHFLNYLHAKRAASKLGRLFVGYAFSEGWAHYTEEMMWEAGLTDGDPVAHVGQLLNALLRNVRFLSSLGLHSQGMTVAESEAMFRDKAFQDPGNAKQQAARGTFDPGYLNYTLGKLMIRKLREDWTASRGGREAWKAFHDQFLSYGGPPIPLVREAMLGADNGGELF